MRIGRLQANPRNVKHHLIIVFLMAFKNSTILFMLVLICQLTLGQKHAFSDESFEIEGFEIFPESDFEFNSLEKVNNDTLNLVICSSFVFYPFGGIESKNDLKSSLLNRFTCEEKIIPEGYYVEILKFKSSKLVLFFDSDIEGARSSYIIQGEIFDNEIILDKNIRIGMSKKDFFSTFFKAFPQNLEQRFNFIGLIACVDGTNHNYTFENDILTEIKFECPDCTWKIEY